MYQGELYCAVSIAVPHLDYELLAIHHADL